MADNNNGSSNNNNSNNKVDPTATPSSPQSPKETATDSAEAKKHKRNVSWDAALRGANASSQNRPDNNKPRTSSIGNADEDAISAVTQPDPVSVSLKDVATAIAPIESEAETLLLSAIEEAQPSEGGGGGQPPQTHALNDLSADEDSLFSPSRAASGRPLPASSRRSVFSRSASRGDTTTHLWELASRLGAQHDRSAREAAAEDGDDNGNHATETTATNGQSELLALHAANLLSHRRVQSSTQGESTAAQPAAVNKWKKLQTAVKVNAAATAGYNNNNNKKKDDDDDDPQPPDAIVAVPSEVLTAQGRPSDGSQRDRLDGGGGGDGDVEEGTASPYAPNNNKNAPGAKAKKGMEKNGVNAEFRAFRQWVSFKKTSLLGYIRKMLLYAILPSTGIAAALFYLGSNPPCGSQRDCLEARSEMPDAEDGGGNTTDTGGDGLIDGLFRGGGGRYDSPSVAWWILFIGVRQVITLSLAMMIETIVIDWWVLRAKSASQILGPYLSLFIVQAKGWPIRFVFWGLLDIGMLYGDRPFARHWLYWQDEVDLFNDTNPGGNVTEDSQYKAFLALMCTWGGLIAMKRFYVGLRLGQKTYARYATDLAKVMRKALLVSEVANLANEIKKYELHTEDFGLHTEIYNEDEEGSNKPPSSRYLPGGSKSQGMLTTLGIAAFASEHKIRINELLGEWEEPELAQSEDEEKVDIGAIIQFRQSLNYLDTQFPFGVLYGRANTRENCVSSAETVYKQLKAATPNTQHLVFDTLALSGLHQDGTLDDHKLREMIKIFRPDRDGKMTLLEFCKSVDAVYKELRLFRASVANAARVDRAFEKIINFVFYFVIGCISLAILGIDPFAVFVAVSGFVLGFAFMIGGACSKYFEGLLMILITKPYDIGDRIQVASATADSSGFGSSYWLVKDVGLYHTTYMLWTQETATCPNGTLANTRIINASRSPQALLITMFKFPIDTPYSKIEIFKATIEKFVKNRPREWLAFFAFRPTRVEADGGFVEYIFIAQHRENWANIGALKNSLADVSFFSLELTKRMDMRYSKPPMPININSMSNDTSWENIQRQMAADHANQSDRLNQSGAASEMALQAPTGRAAAGSAQQQQQQQQQYDFTDIEEMFSKNQ